jgi:hypothetical protein
MSANTATRIEAAPLSFFDAFFGAELSILTIQQIHPIGIMEWWNIG